MSGINTTAQAKRPFPVTRKDSNPVIGQPPPSTQPPTNLPPLSKLHQSDGAQVTFFFLFFNIKSFMLTSTFLSVVISLANVFSPLLSTNNSTSFFFNLSTAQHFPSFYSEYRFFFSWNSNSSFSK